MIVDQIIQKTKEYISIPAVVGHEGLFMRHLQAEFQEMGFSTETYPGLLVVQGDDPLSAIVSAHIDRHGLISIGGGEYAYAAQYVKEIKYGQQNTASQTELEAISKRFEGERVFAYDPDTGKKRGEGTITSCRACMAGGNAVFHLHDMTPEDMNTPVAYAKEAETQSGYFRGQLDNTISLGVLYALCRNGFQGTLLLTTEEEIGKSWKHMADWLQEKNINARELIILDTSPYSDYEPIDRGVVVFRNRDKSEVFNGDLVGRLKERCDGLNIPYQLKDEYLLAQGKEIRQLGSTELGRLISESQGRWTGATVQIPTVMYHTSNETTSHESIKNYYGFLQNILIDEKVGKFLITGG